MHHANTTNVKEVTDFYALNTNRLIEVIKSMHHFITPILDWHRITCTLLHPTIYVYQVTKPTYNLNWKQHYNGLVLIYVNLHIHVVSYLSTTATYKVLPKKTY